MNAVWFREMDEGKPTGVIGLAVARDAASLFWQIDAHIDPFSVEIMTAHEGSIMWVQGAEVSEGNREVDSDYEKFDVPFADEKGWRKPGWATDPGKIPGPYGEALRERFLAALAEGPVGPDTITDLSTGGRQMRVIKIGGNAYRMNDDSLETAALYIDESIDENWVEVSEEDGQTKAARALLAGDEARSQ